MRRGKIKTFFKYYLFRLNNGMPGRQTRDKIAQIPHESGETGYPPTFKQEGKSRPVINLLLLIITFCTTTLAGAGQGESALDIIISGLPYSVTLMLILGIHEMGHYTAAKKFGVKATLPYFIPFPSIVGTMGAVIKTKSPIPHRKALFYIGAMGPLPGFIASLTAVTAGVYLSQIEALPVPGQIPLPVFGDSLLFRFIVNFIHGPIPAGHDIFLHPVAWAGWIGFLITSLNLMPIGQLDGGHILYALIGEKQVDAGWAAFGMLIILSFFWPGWIVWIIMTLVILMIAHPYVPEGPPLTKSEVFTGWMCMAVLVLTFIPVPVEFL